MGRYCPSNKSKEIWESFSVVVGEIGTPRVTQFNATERWQMLSDCQNVLLFLPKKSLLSDKVGPKHL